MGGGNRPSDRRQKKEEGMTRKTEDCRGGRDGSNKGCDIMHKGRDK